MEPEEITPKSYPRNLLAKDWNKRKCYFRKGGADLMEKVHDMEVKADDVWVVTLPKCGTTWMQELLWLVLNDYDFETAKNVDLEVRTPFLEFNFFIKEDAQTALNPVEGLSSPRLIKSHLPLPLLPAQLWQRKTKVIYVYRNPKDAMVSSYYHRRSLGFCMNLTLEECIKDGIDKDSLTQLPFEHVTEFYVLRHEPWLFYTSFERMKLDLRGVIEEVCQFLNKSINEQQMQQMLHHLSFEEMKNNPKTNHHWEFEQVRRKLNLPYEQHNFVRKGAVGGYKEELSSETISKLNEWITQSLTPYKVTLEELLLLQNNADKKVL